VTRNIPERIDKLVKPFVDSSPEYIKTPICFSYWIYLRKRLQIEALTNSRKYRSHIDPFQIYWVSPGRISHYCKSRFGNRYGPYIKEGEWDQNVKPFNENISFMSIKERFKNDESWEYTPLYERLNNKYDTVEEMLNKPNYSEYIDDAEEVKDIEDILEKKYGSIYENIKKNGYRTQRELRPVKSRIQNPGRIPNAVPELDEITVDISRNGTLIWYRGQHRLSIAKILGLKKVPVRIRCRHQKWMKIREKVINSPETAASKIGNHPDIRDLYD